jgi:exosortase/archaeosortase family protein
VGKGSGTIFIIKILAIYLSWKFFAFLMGAESQPLEERFFPGLSYYWEWLNNQVRIMLLNATAGVLSLSGYETAISSDRYVLNIINHRGVGVGNYCLAFQMMYFFTCLIIISPLTLRVKLWSIPLGLVVIQSLNVFRFVAMHLAIVFFPGLEERMHDYFFNAIALAVLLILYSILLRRFG